jgi:MFS family permease
MIYPLLPVFLIQYLGAGQAFIGLIEGFAESAAAFLNLCSGIWSDRVRDRSRLVLGGYTLSSLTKPLMAVAFSPWVVLIVRFFDRIGKGIRISPRDALIADSVESTLRGRAYGFHRSFNHAGAIAGPLLATFLLTWFIKDLRHLFAIAAIPGLAAVVVIIWQVREILPADRTLDQNKFKLEFPKGKLGVYLAILFLFTLSCSSDAFLLLRANELGIPVALVPVMWLVLHAVKLVTAFPLGNLSDHVGHRRLILTGWMVYTLVYFTFAFASESWHAWMLFAVYGLFYGLTEGIEPAILADYAPAHQRGQAFGWYYFIIGLAILPANLVFGFVWQALGPKFAFLMSASVSALAAFSLFIFLQKYPSVHKKTAM